MKYIHIVKSRLKLFIIALLLSATSTVCAQPRASILFVKPGELNATQRQAAGFLRDFSAYLHQHVGFLRKKTVKGLIANRNTEGLTLLRKNRPEIAFVSAGFYLEHLRNKSTPVAQMPRFGAKADRFYLVTSKAGPDSIRALKSREVHTTFSIDWKYLQRVVFPADVQPGKFFTLKPVNNISDAMFILIEGTQQEKTFDALLLDEDLLNFFKRDKLVWPELKVIWKSEKLPPGLVVLIGKHSVQEVRELSEALFRMSKDKEGKRLLRLMNSFGFKGINNRLLNKAARHY